MQRMDGERSVGQFACTFDKNAVMSSRLHRETEKRGEGDKTSYIPHLWQDQHVLALTSNINELDVPTLNANQQHSSS